MTRAVKASLKTPLRAAVATAALILILALLWVPLAPKAAVAMAAIAMGWAALSIPMGLAMAQAERRIDARAAIRPPSGV